MDQIVARKKEKKRLQELYLADEAQFLAIYGRRRVGKTYLIREFFKNKGRYFELTGVKDGSLSVQLQNFSIEMGITFGKKYRENIPLTWNEAFNNLRVCIEEMPPEEKLILFFDELPWLATPKSGHLQALDYFWNRYLSQKRNSLLIVCGSAASWMLKKIIHNRGGLYGRLTEQMCLMPYTLKETEEYLHARNVDLDRKQIIDLYMAFGGVPKYLSYISRGQSSAQIIQENCFTPYAPLVLEFEKLFASLFKNYKQHLRIIEALSKKRIGLTQNEIIHETGFPSGGNLTRLLDELSASGFILFTPQLGNKKRQGRYRLIDEYSLFFLSWIAPMMEKHLKYTGKGYWERIQGSPSFQSWAGYTFEGICLKHIDQIVEILKLSVVATSASSWYSSIKEEKGQIDLIIKRADRCMNLCEIKFCQDTFTISKEYANKLRHKKELFRTATNTKDSLFLTLITTYGAKENRHYHSIIDQQLTMDALFQ